MKNLFMIAVLLLAITSCQNSKQNNDAHENANIPKPTPAQITWQNSEIGVLFHLDISVLTGDYAKNNTSRKVFDPKLYNPSKLNTDQWVKAAKAAGAKYAIFTATHFCGFMQWQSDLYPYGLKQSPWRDGKGDIVDDFVTSCRKAGIKPGIYFSTHRNVYNQVWSHYVDWGKGKGTEKQEDFNRIAEKMTEELCSRYGELIQIWFDAGVKTPKEGGPDVLPIFEKYQPNSVFYSSIQRSDHRWIGNESGYAGNPCWATMPGKYGQVSHNSPTWTKILSTGDLNGTVWSPAMVDIPLRGANGIHNWIWNPDQEQGIYSTEKLTEMYYTSVGHNSNLIIGVVINPEGLVPDPDVKRLAEFGDEINRRFEKALAETSGGGKNIELKLDKPQRINHVIIMEDIAKGERISKYVVEGLTNENKWQKLCAGQSVGHKWINKFPATEVSKVRLRIEESVAKPAILEFSVYQIE